MSNAQQQATFARECLIVVAILSTVLSLLGCANGGDSVRDAVGSWNSRVLTGKPLPHDASKSVTNAPAASGADIIPTLVEPWPIPDRTSTRGWYADNITGSATMQFVNEPGVRGEGPRLTLSDLRSVRTAVGADVVDMLELAHMPRLTDVGLLARAVAPLMISDPQNAAALLDLEQRGHGLARLARQHTAQATEIATQLQRDRELLNIQTARAVHGDAAAKSALLGLAARVARGELWSAAVATTRAFLATQHLLRLRQGASAAANDAFFIIRTQSFADALSVVASRASARTLLRVSSAASASKPPAGCFVLDRDGRWDEAERTVHSAACGSMEAPPLVAGKTPQGLIPLSSLRVLGGTWKGSFACDPGRSVELTISKQSDDEESLFVEGRLQAYDTMGGTAPVLMDTTFTGNMRPDTGIAYLNSRLMNIGEPPKPEPARSPSLLNRLLKGTAPVAAPAAPRSNSTRSVAVVLARDSDGLGLAGTMEAEWLDCHEVHLRRTDNIDTRALPMPSSDVAYATARISPAFLSGVSARPVEPLPRLVPDLRTAMPARPASTPVDFSGAYWLRLAMGQGSLDAKVAMAALLERGVAMPRDDTGAAKLYRELAAADDARGQASLAAMLMTGRGVPRNELEARRLSALALNTERAALAICARPDSASTIWKIIDASLKNPDRAVGQELVRSFGNIDFEVGGFLLESIRTERVSNLARPFRCIAKGRLANFRVTDITPRIETTVVDQRGVVLYRYDNSFDRSIGQASAGMISQTLQRTPVELNITALPLAPKRYRLVLSGNGLGDLGPRYGADIQVP